MSWTPPSFGAARSFRRMRVIASLLLLLMTVTFLLSWHYRASHVAMPYLQAFAEAAMVGGLADWFAIVALFRRPFGLPIPHTAIIPANKARIGRSLGDFLSQYLLDQHSLGSLLRRLDLAPHAGRWLTDADHAEKLADWLLAQTPALSELWEDIEGEKQLFALAAELPLAPILAGGMARAGAKGLHQSWIGALLTQLTLFVEEHRGDIRDKLSAHSYRWVPEWVDGKVADMLGDALIGLLLDLQSPEHRWRLLLDAKIADLPKALARHPDWQEKAAAWQRTLLSDPDLQDSISTMLAGLRKRLAIDHASLAGLLRQLGGRLAEDGQWQQTLQGWIERVAERALLPRKQAIGGFVADMVANWDDHQLVQRLETEVGADLHYIRLNGTLVGGLVGLALYGMTRWLG